MTAFEELGYFRSAIGSHYQENIFPFEQVFKQFIIDFPFYQFKIQIIIMFFQPFFKFIFIRILPLTRFIDLYNTYHFTTELRKEVCELFNGKHRGR